MYFKRDTVKYTIKPASTDIAGIQIRLKNMDQVEFSLEELIKTIEQGSSFYLCEFKENKSVAISNVLGTSMLAVDIDNKEHITTLEEVLELIRTNFNSTPMLSYHTFSSSKDIPKFRIIYKLNRFVVPEEFKKVYNMLILTINKEYEVIDNQASNINRLWAGSNKKVIVYDNQTPLNADEIISRIPKAPERKKAPKIIDNPSNYKHSDKFYLKNHRLVAQQLIDEIDIRDFLETHWGVRIEKNRCCCPIHGSDNKTSLAIYDTTVHCYTSCGTMNIINLAREYWKIHDFEEIAFRLIEEYDLDINENLLGLKGEK